MRFGNEESERGEGAVADFGFAVFGEVIIVDGEKNHKKQGADAFVAVIKWVILDSEIEEVGGLSAIDG